MSNLEAASLNLDFSTAPTVWKFLRDDSFVRGIMGPVGSGKSYACAAEIMLRAVRQKPSPRDGIRYTRFAVVRNSYPMLKTTTLKTWMEIFPENIWGNAHWSPPITHHIKLPSRGDAHGVDCEVIFLALDQPKDVRKLLSLELTGAWINECRELPKAIIDGLSHRVGRYPTQADGGATWRGIWADTNPMDSDHYWYRLAEGKEAPGGKYAWQFFRQPPGVLETSSEDLPDQPEFNGFVQSAGKWWMTNPVAENIHNLPDGYYEQLVGGKNLDWIRCYAKGEYTYVQEGKSITPEYDDDLMTVDGLQYDPSLPVQIGLDFGLTPAACFGQRHPSGQWRILHELVTFDMGLERFCNSLKAELEMMFPKADVMVWGDPAGQQRDQIYEVTAFDFLKTIGMLARPAATNDWKTRREAMAAPMIRFIDKKPGLLVDKKCNRTRKALAGGYHFSRVSMGSGQERFRDVPNKNEHSHIGDAYGYLVLGGGEHKRMTRRPATWTKLPVASSDFNVFA
tara:strand:+ start:2125 stop:3651 length:1527 start_codon:yes stop_codon:yes gene_type:complete